MTPTDLFIVAVGLAGFTIGLCAGWFIIGLCAEAQRDREE